MAKNKSILFIIMAKQMSTRWPVGKSGTSFFIFLPSLLVLFFCFLFPSFLLPYFFQVSFLDSETK
jgi:hypothetical protein